jgi:hypothetical protein
MSSMVRPRGVVRSGLAAVIVVALGACKFPYPPPVESDAVDGTLLDASIDGSTDAPPIPFFDVAYPSDWKFSVSGPTHGFVLIVNTGTAPLGLATFQVTSVSDDHPTAVARVTAPTTPGAILQPGNAGGALSEGAQSLLITSGVVPEAWSDRKSDLLSLELVNAPSGTYDVAVNLTIELENHDVPLPMTIHVVPGPTIYLDPILARRVRVYR